ncbi:hypothetical protein D7Z54_32690 [Salibacterium salarium]|uniref:Uncharacterized protein n=1 Tax=Salibacterium salarium TaxID=284579 RepID=A0A3R9QFB5_9BACI|nr:hypothetical protein [Salibacterium salarium]RSL29165.1 hypothetical protein D7Z54_32690 [Salibacterium salarium]
MAKEQEKRFIKIKEEYVAITGGFNEAAVLEQMIQWYRATIKKDSENRQLAEKMMKLGTTEAAEKILNQIRDGWFYKSATDLSNDMMGFKKSRAVKDILNNLVDQGFLLADSNRNKAKFDKTTHYKVNMDRVQYECQKLGFSVDGYMNFNDEEMQDLANKYEEAPKGETAELQKMQMDENTQNPRHVPFAFFANGRAKNANGRAKNANLYHLIQSSYTNHLIQDQNLNPKPNQSETDKKMDTLWDLDIPKGLKIKVKNKILDDTWKDLTFKDLEALEDAYHYQIRKGYVDPECGHTDMDSLNDQEFTKTIVKLLDTVTVKEIRNIRGLIKEWVEQAFCYKREEQQETPYIGGKLPSNNWLID